MFKNVDWKKIGIIVLKISIVLILNVPLWVYLIGKMIPYANFNNGEFKLSWIEYLELSKQVPWYAKWFLYIGIGIGAILSFMFLKWWYEATKKERDKKELIASQEVNTAKIVEAINKEQQKKEEKANKDVRKYL